MTATFQYGAYELFWAFRNSNGYPVGQETAPDNVAVNTTTHAYRLSNIIDFTHPQPTFGVATDFGGQKIRAQADMGVNNFGEGSFTLSEFDDVFHAFITGGSVDTTTVTDRRTAGSNINKVAKPRGFLMAVARGQAVTNTTITDVYKSYVYPNVQVRPAFANLSQNDGVNPNPVSYTFVPSQSTRGVDGYLFANTAMNLEEDKELFYEIESDNPLGLTTYVKNGVATTFTLGYRPLSSTATGTAQNSITNNGTLLAVTSVNTTTGVVTLTAAGTSGDIVVVLYETAFESI